jgi:ribonuclease G
MASNDLIIINVDFGETRVALIEDGIIVELLMERRDHRSLVGNVYRGRVIRVLPGMQAAFVDVSLDRHAFIHVSDMVSPEDLDPLENGEDGDQRARKVTRRTPIREIVKEGESIVVQISKDPIGTKGSRATADVSLAGRHLVYMPFSERGGISRRIEDDRERARLRKILTKVAPDRGALIARTAAEGAGADELAADAGWLVDTWEEIRARHKRGSKPALLRADLDLPLRVARDSLRDNTSKLVVDNASTAERLRSFVDRLIPSKLDAIELYEGSEPIFDAFGIEAEIRRALERVVELPSGGSLVIDQGEALTAIDVNTGKFVGKGSRDQEETILRTNLEAVDEIAYQVRFRNIGGLIVLDLIDMDRSASRRKVMKRLEEKLEHDRAKTSVMQISHFGLVEMTRERTRESLGRRLHEPCACCDGTGNTLSRVTVANEVMREVLRRHDELGGSAVEVRLNPAVLEVFRGEAKAPLGELQKRIGKQVVLTSDRSMHIEAYHVRARKTKAGGEGS